MKIAIDISVIKTGHAFRGTGSYTRLLIEALQRYEAKHTYYFFTRGQKLPENIDLVHYPYFDPFFLTLPLRKPRPVVVTVHDLIPIVYATHFPCGLRGKLKWQIQRWSLSQAREVITDSQASKIDIRRYTGILQNKIHVVYLAPADIYRSIRDSQLLERIRTRYHLPRHFILYVGDVNWNKNVPGLLKAFRNIKYRDRKENREEICLVLVGKAFEEISLQENQNINEIIEQFNLVSDVIKLGFVPDKDLVAIYSLASVYVQPSLAEGFGLPVLEAMACGCPTVTARISSLKEIAGPSVLVDAGNSDEMALGIRKALRLNREIWAKEAEAWVAKYNWKQTAASTVAVYEQSLND